MLKDQRIILLVDDDEDDQVLFMDALSELHTEAICEVAQNGVAAIDRIMNKKIPDLIFLDLNMPLMDGFNCLFQLRHLEATKNTPVIVYTTTHNPDTVAEVKKLGANAFFTKPNDFKSLRNILSALLKRDFNDVSLVDDFKF